MTPFPYIFDKQLIKKKQCPGHHGIVITDIIGMKKNDLLVFP
jgi:hypothetical protein